MIFPILIFTERTVFAHNLAVFAHNSLMYIKRNAFYCKKYIIFIVW
ncbi:hypothetical protein SAMN04488494_0071 [Xylanibacter ruminicola]|uniref:Uncharacterized protein n=1 Tax=Xylanibacter ruminicola TaxID=839 RepID=A0A1M7NJA3_XYLRU|nr:hypothetical protein SAMN04488493_11124 [Xylanibacter ruminicola]SHN03926.1 hypothetical protein SAMN04488494_0071 [Xylanibacter ruminicola]